MLVLSRRQGESIVIGTPPHRVKVTVVSFKNGTVRLGTTAGDDVPIHREEILERIEREAEGAARHEQVA